MKHLARDVSEHDPARSIGVCGWSATLLKGEFTISSWHMPHKKAVPTEPCPALRGRGQMAQAFAQQEWTWL